MRLLPFIVAAVIVAVSYAQTLQITDPAAGTVWISGQDQVIRWTGSCSNARATVSLYTGSGNLQLVETLGFVDCSGSLTSYGVILPSSIPPGTGYILSVGSLPYVAYSQQFTISAPTTTTSGLITLTLSSSSTISTISTTSTTSKNPTTPTNSTTNSVGIPTSTPPTPEVTPVTKTGVSPGLIGGIVGGLAVVVIIVVVIIVRRRKSTKKSNSSEEMGEGTSGSPPNQESLHMEVKSSDDTPIGEWPASSKQSTSASDSHPSGITLPQPSAPQYIPRSPQAIPTPGILRNPHALLQPSDKQVSPSNPQALLPPSKS